jgi:hypothetical protein
MPVATQNETPLVALPRRAPIATAGQTLGPSRSSAAIAIPVGGQTGVMTPWPTARLRPSFAPPK